MPCSTVIIIKEKNNFNHVFESHLRLHPHASITVCFAVFPSHQKIYHHIHHIRYISSIFSSSFRHV